MTRRTFDLQMYRISPEFRASLLEPLIVDLLSQSDKRQGIFVNLRRLVMIDKQYPIEIAYKANLQTGATSPVPFINTGFQVIWMRESGLPVDTDIRVTLSTECGCDTCSFYKHSTAYHVHWKIRDSSVLTWMSLGIIVERPLGREVVSDWGPSETLETREDYTYAAGLAIDDALHDCALNGLSDDQCLKSMIEHVTQVLSPRLIVGYATIVNIRPEIKRFENATRIRCSIDVKGQLLTQTFRVNRTIQHTLSS